MSDIRCEDVNMYEMSHSQQRIWFNDQINLNSNSMGKYLYNLTFGVKLEGDLDVKKLEKSMQLIIDRHDIFRTTFDMVNNKPSQIVHDDYKFNLGINELNGISDTEFDKILENNCNVEFDLKKLPLFKLQLYKHNDREYSCVMVIHHIIFDGWSNDILFNELFSNYFSLENIGEVNAEPLPIQYYDFAHWQNQVLLSDEMNESKQYWINEYSQSANNIDFPLDYAREKKQQFEGDTIDLKIKTDTYNKIKDFCRSQRTSVNSFMLSCFVGLLYLYTGNEEIIIGTSLSGRTHPDIKELIGCFINTVPLKFNIEEKMSFTQLLNNCNSNLKQVMEHQDYPFDALVKELKLERDLSRNPIFTVLFQYNTWKSENSYIGNEKMHNGINVLPMDLKPKVSLFDFSVELNQKRDCIEGYIQFATSLIKKNTLVVFREAYIKFIEAVILDVNKDINDLDVISTYEKNLQLHDFNKTKFDFDNNLCVSQIFYNKSAEFIDKNVISYLGNEFTYKYVNERSNQIAHLLRKLGCSRNCFVGILKERNIDFIISALAIIKAGGAYVPIDTNIPEQRLRYIIQDSKIEFIITERNFIDLLSEYEQFKGIISLEECDKKQNKIFGIDMVENSNKSNLGCINSLEDYAYMIYTSGSTGKPKGAIVRQKGMLNHIFSKIKDLNITDDDVILQSASISFDISVWQIFVPLLSGANMVIIPTNILLESKAFSRYIYENKVSIMQIVPSIFNVFTEFLENNREYCDIVKKYLRIVLSIGAELPKSSVERWLALFDSIEVINSYGPTEASDTISHYHVKLDELRKYTKIPIGKPLYNMNIYIVNKNMKLVPIGVKGEICVSGKCVGAGYWQNDELTNSKFLENPFLDDVNHEILYKTGDIGSWTEDGMINFWGRNDNQVKIRGYRIELEEIETSLLKYCKDITNVAVIAKQGIDSEKILVAFYTSNNEINSENIKKSLQKGLPNYMIPAYFIKLDNMPMLASGKINRTFLNDMKLSLNEQEVSIEDMNLNYYEKEIASIWLEEIGYDVSINKKSNFFNIGGHSILGIKVINKLTQKFNIDISLQDIFEYGSLEELALRVEDMVKNGEKSERLIIEHLEPLERYALAPVQKPEWYLHELEPNSSFYNVNFNFLLKGKLDLQAFHKAIQYLINRHNILRSSFKVIDNIPYQIIKDKLNMDLNSFYSEEFLSANKTEEEFVKNKIFNITDTIFNFEEGPIFKINLLKYEEDKYLFILVTHHIIWDETSSMNFSKELTTAYNSYKKGHEPELPELKLNYSDYSRWMNSSIENGYFDKYKKYWLEKYSLVPEPLNLPTDNPRPPIQTFNGDTEFEIISEELRGKIYNYCNENDITLNIFLLSVLNLQIYKLTGNKDFVVGSPMINRDDTNLEHVLGLFATGIPLRCNIDDKDTFKDLILKTKEETIQTYDNHLYPINYIIEDLKLKNDLSRSKLFAIMFGVQKDKNKMIQELKFDDLDVDFRTLNFDENTARFDFTLSIEVVEQLIINLNYNTDLFKKSTARRMIKQYLKLIEDVLNDENKNLGKYNIFLESDRKIIQRANQTVDNLKAYETILDKIDIISQNNPNQIAIKAYDNEISYKDLINRADNLAKYIIGKYDIKLEDRIGLMFEPSIECIVVILAILKSGATYVPMGVDYPDNRVNKIIEKAEIKLLITNEEVNSDNYECRCFKYGLNTELILENKMNIANCVRGGNSAYVIFTSGSTGEPKGIEIEHKGILNLFEWTQDEYQFSVGDSILFITPYTFDVSILDILFPLTVGARIVVASEEDRRIPGKVGELATKENIVLLQFVPDMLSAFIDSYEAKEFAMPTSLKCAVCAGGILTRKLVERFKKNFSCKLSNHYGPTEATVDSTCFHCDNEYEGEVVPIGKPLSNTKIYILNDALQQVPIGVPGELCIESVGLARGYVNDLKQTEKAFIKVDIPGEGQRRLYRTGDVAKYLDDGNIMFIGRKDNQIKIRGNRVELEEIENKVSSIDGVKSGAVICNKDLISAFVELEKKNTLVNKNGEYFIYTLAQMPYKINAVHKINSQVWPEYFKYNKMTKEYWPILFDEYLKYQIVILSEDDEVVAAGNTIPIYWDGKDENIPIGWDEALRIGIEKDYDKKPNTLLVLAGIIPKEHQGKGLSSLILNSFKILAKSFKLDKILVPVRPIEKKKFPMMTIDDYSKKLDEKGLLYDNWLRVHQHVGGRIIRSEEKSQTVVAPINEWKRWINVESLEENNECYHDECLSKISIDVNNGVGIYYDPCIWVEHFIENQDIVDVLSIEPINVLKYLEEYLPKYMIPNSVKILNRLPKLSNEKIDKKQLVSFIEKSSFDRKIIKPRNEEEQQIKNIWLEMLKIDDVSIDDNFYDVGGHSLLATVLLYKINEKYSVNYLLKDFLQEPYINKMVEYINCKKVDSKNNNNKIDIKPIHDINNDCFEDQICTILKWLDYESYLIPMYSWSFEYKSNENSSSIGSKLSSGSDVLDIFRILDDEYKITIIEKSFDNGQNAINYIEFMLSNNQPVVVLDDSFYCSWDVNYKKYHDHHSCIVTGIDKDKEFLLCTDAYNSMCGIKYFYKDFLLGFKGSCFVLEQREKVDMPNKNNILKKLIQKIDNNKDSYFDDMLRFSSDFTKVNLSAELGNNIIIQNCDLHRNIYTIKRKRYQVLSLLKFINDDENKVIIEKFEKACELWENIYLLTTKALIKTTDKKLILKISDLLKEVCFIEKDIFYNIKTRN